MNTPIAYKHHTHRQVGPGFPFGDASSNSYTDPYYPPMSNPMMGGAASTMGANYMGGAQMGANPMGGTQMGAANLGGSPSPPLPHSPPSTAPQQFYGQNGAANSSPFGNYFPFGPMGSPFGSQFPFAG